jgi:hypothetical protein
MARNLVHEKSAESMKTELDLFQPPPTQTSLEKGFWHEIPPSATLTDDGPLEFHVSGSGDEYIDLMHTMLHLKVRIVKETGGAINADETVSENLVAPVNLFIHSLFSQVETTLNGKIIGHMNTMYPYRAMLETLLNFGKEPCDSHLQTSLFYKDTASYMDVVDPRLTNPSDYVHEFNSETLGVSYVESRAGAANTDPPVLVPADKLGNGGLNLRYKFTRQNQWVDMIGPIHSDIFLQERYLINGVDLGVRFTRSKPKFCLMSPSTAPHFKVQISDASLYVRKVKIADSVFLAHQNALSRANLVYPLTHYVLKSFSIAGNSVGPSDNTFVGQLPTEMVVVFVDSDAANGNYLKNPFNFKTMDIQQFMIKFDGVQVPAKPLSPKFSDGKSTGTFVRAYQSLFNGTGKLFTNHGSIIRRQDYAQGYCIFAFDFRADIGSRGHYSLRRNGCVQVDVQFGHALPNTINMIVCGEFDSFIEVTRSREIISFGVS